MKGQSTSVILDRERILAEGMRELASELRLIDVVEFVSYIRFEKNSHLVSLVNSAAEMYFIPGSVMFNSSADVHIDWGAAPTVWLNLEFRNRNVRAFFSLALDSCHAGVELDYVSFESPDATTEQHTQMLSEAITDARMQFSRAVDLPKMQDLRFS